LIFQESGLIAANESVGDRFYRMALFAPRTASKVKPGQFIHLKCSDTADPLLRRPFSVYDWDEKKKMITILYAVVGRGTEMMSKMKSGEKVNLMAPLGTSFSIDVNFNEALVIGGGCGIGPLLGLVKQLVKKGIETTTLLGMQTGQTSILIDDFLLAGATVKVATNDGSIGIKGHVTEFLENTEKKEKPDFVYACGPNPMLVSVQKWARKQHIPGEISIEEKMGCGTGACLSCACRIQSQDNEDGWDYKRVCVEGPVFSLEEVIFDE